jgi:LCP family protein required for cell wall assembly
MNLSMRRGCLGVRKTLGNKRFRVLISLLSTIFVVFSSMMFFQNLSVGTDEPESVETDTEDPVTVTPEPTNDVYIPEPNTPVQELKLTNNQKYFEQLVSPDSTNILIAASDPTGWNFDTIMIVNVDKTEKQIRFINLPRDIYIDYSDFVYDRMEKVKPGLIYEKGMLKINAAPSIGNRIEYKKNVGRFEKPYIDFLCDLIDEVFDIHIDDFIYVKVNGVRNIINYFGGVDIYVDRLMNYYDPTQDLDIYIEPGMRHLNGEDAEKFLRFRQGHDENGVFRNYGDIYRKQNQNRFMQAFIKQKLTLSNIGKLAKISEVITQNVITSVKGWESILAYGELAEEIVRDGYETVSMDVKTSDKRINGVEYVVIKTEP